MLYKINFLWDNDVSVWIATRDDIPGLVLESGSFDALVEKVKYAAMELLEVNKQEMNNLKLSYYVEREDMVVNYG